MFDIIKISVPGSKPSFTEPELSNIPEPLPRPYATKAFRMIIIGPSGSGKSNIYTNLLTRAYNKVFDKVYIFCPTFYNDHTLNILVKKSPQGRSFLEDNQVFTFSTIEEITDQVKQIMKDMENEIQETPEDEAPPKCLLLFDDLTNELKDAQIMKDLFTKGRKYEISVIVITNKYKVYSPQIRNNATQFVIFNPGTEQEIDDLSKDIANGIDPKRIKQAMKRVFQNGQHSFMYVNNASKSRFWNMFQEDLKITG